MDETFFRRMTAVVILAILLVLSFFMLNPILLSIIVGLLLAFLFSPVYDRLHRVIKPRSIPALIICIVLLLMIILPLWFFTPTIIDESIKLYHTSQQLDLVTPLKAIFPSLFASKEFSQEVGSITQSFITKLTNSLMNYVSSILLNFPMVIMQIFIIFFVFFYALRDKDEILNYIRSLLPFSKEVEKKLFDSTRDITWSVLYGNVLVGTIQGIILGIGFFIFGAPNPFLLLIFGILVGILPVLGPSIVGIPVALILLVNGNPFSAFGILAFTLLASISDQIIRPLFVSRRTKLHNALVLTGMVGGFLLFGILGFILGPLILAYLIIIIEVYRNKSIL
jgi:predicted PurR-regulated permease PerM